MTNLPHYPLTKILLVLFMIFLISLTESFSQRVIVISGGGARGAWGGGVAESLHKQKKFNYDLAIGTSTGSLLAPFIISKNFEKAKESYTGVTQRSIFNVNPFKKKKGKEDQIKFLPAIWRILIGKKTIGESKNLRKLIRRDIPIDVYEQMLEYEFIVTVVNFSTAKTRYFSNQDYDTRVYDCTDLVRKELKECKSKKDSVYKEMTNWIWASGNQPLFMSLLKTKADTAERVTKSGKRKPVTDKHYWVDGGIRENIAILEGIEHILEHGDVNKTDTIDAIINNTRQPHMTPLENPKILKSLFRTIDILTYDTRQNDVRLPGYCQESGEQTLIDTQDPEFQGNIVVNLYFMTDSTYNIHPKELLFHAESMKKLWNLGNNFEESAVIKHCTISKDVAQKLVDAGRSNFKLY